MKFHVPDMSCGHCTAAIEKALKTIDPDARVDTDLTSKTVMIASAKDAAALQTALKEAGYPATPA
jgi:copper chaperone